MSDPSKPEYPVVFMRCTRGSDQRTQGQKCDGKQAYKMSPDGHRNPMYKCVKCTHLFTVSLGGSFNV